MKSQYFRKNIIKELKRTSRHWYRQNYPIPIPNAIVYLISKSFLHQKKNSIVDM